MNANANPVAALLWTFGLMSLFAVGGANSAIPEMHRVAVDVQHWMTDKQFADVFAISQLSPGPNVLIVTLIGYSVAGVAGALAATLAMCGPTAILAYYVSRLLARSSHSRWPAIIQAALVPLSIGLMGASGLILAQAADQTWIAALMTAAAAGLAFATRRRERQRVGRDADLVSKNVIGAHHHGLRGTQGIRVADPQFDVGLRSCEGEVQRTRAEFSAVA